MKTLLSSMLLAVALLATPAVTTGCQTSGRQVTYKTLMSLVLSVNAAEDAYVAALKQGLEVPEDVDMKLVEVDNEFRRAMSVAIRAAEMDWQAVASKELVDLATEIILTIEEITR